MPAIEHDYDRRHNYNHDDGDEEQYVDKLKINILDNLINDYG